MNRREIMTSTLVSAGLALLGLGAAASAEKAEWLVSYVPDKHEWERADTEAKLIPVFDVRAEDEPFDLATRVFDWVRPITDGGPTASLKPDFVWVRMGDGWTRVASLYDATKRYSLDLPPLVEPKVYMTPAAVKHLWNQTLVRAARDTKTTPNIFGASIVTLDDWHSSFVTLDGDIMHEASYRAPLGM